MRKKREEELEEAARRRKVKREKELAEKVAEIVKCKNAGRALSANGRELIHFMSNLRYRANLLVSEHVEIAKKLAKLDVADEDFSADANLHSLKPYAGYAAFWSAALARGNVKGYVGKAQISPQEARQQVKRRLLGLRADKVVNLYRKGKPLLSDPFLRGWRSSLFDKK